MHCTKMKQSDLLLVWNKKNNNTGIGWYVVHGGIGFYCFDQGLIPSQKVCSTCQLVEKILGWSTEKSYHESWD